MALALTGAGLATMVSGAAPAGAAPISPTCDNAVLVQAIDTANSLAGPDTISLPTGCTYTFSAADNHWYGPNALPEISSTITIEGNGAIIERSSAVNTPNFRLFYVGADPADADTLAYTSPGAGDLTLRNLTLRGGLAKGGHGGVIGGGGMGAGGAVFNQGHVTLDAVTAAANTAQGGSNDVAGVGGGGGGIGTNGQDGGGGFGPGTFGGAAGGAAGPGSISAGSGGGGGFRAADAGGAGVSPYPGGNGGGPNTGTGGKGGGATSASGGNGSGGGGQGGYFPGTGASGGAFGQGGARGGSTGGGGGVGGGGGDGWGAGGGGFGGGGGGGGGGQPGTGGFGGGGGGTVTGGAPGGFGGGSSDDGGGGGGMGGAVFNHQGELDILNSTLAENIAAGGGTGASSGSGVGGAVFNLNGVVNVTNSTLAANTATNGGSQIYNLAYDSDTARATQLTLVNSIVADGPSGADLISNKPATTSAGTNVAVPTVTFDGPNIVESFAIIGDLNGTASSADPGLGPLMNNGGPGMETMLPAETSPAIDAGQTTGCPATDERGITRPQRTGCDLGAVEVVPAPPGSCSFTGGVLHIDVDGTTTVSRSGNDIVVTPGGTSCNGATVLNTDTIDVDGGANADTLVIDLSNGQLAPGITAEPSGVSEIEINVDLGAGADTLEVRGTPGNDLMVLGTNGIAISGDNDLDVLPTGVEAFRLLGQGANDTLRSGGSAIAGASVAALLDGGPGNDTITGGALGDAVVGGTGLDNLQGGYGPDVIEGGDDNDTLFGGDGLDVLRGGTGNDVIYGDTGNDTFDEETASNGADTFVGGSGIDVLSYAARANPLTVVLNNTAGSGEAGEGDKPNTDIENLTGGSGADKLTGNNLNNTITGGLGADQLFGLLGNDLLLALDSVVDTTLDGGAGTDTAQKDAGDLATGVEVFI